MNPWAAFTLYVAGLVYCHDLRLSYEPTQDGLSNVTFLLAVMKSIDLYQPITEYFTVQLEIELEAAQTTRKGKQRQGRILCPPGNQECEASQSTLKEFEDDSQPWNSLSSEKAAGPYANPPFHQPLIGILSLNCGADPAPEQQSQAATNDSSPGSSSARGQEKPRQADYGVLTEHALPSNHKGTVFDQHHNTANRISGGLNNASDEPHGQERVATTRGNAYDGTSTGYEWPEGLPMSSNSYGRGYPETRGQVAEKQDSQDRDTFQGRMGTQPMSSVHHAIPLHTRASAFDEIFNGDPQYETFQGIDWDTFNNEYWGWNQNP